MAARKGNRAEVAIAAIDKVAAPVRRINRRIETMLRPINRVKRAARSLAREMHLGAMVRGVGNLGRSIARLGVVGVAGLAAVYLGVKRLAEAGDDLGKLTRRLGVNVEEFQKLEFAADRMGVSSSAFRKSFGTFAKITGELQAGTGALFTLLQKTDPAFKRQLERASGTSEAMGLMLDKIHKLKNPLHKAALASAAFSRGGQTMIQFADAGSKEIARLTAEAERLGGVMSEEETLASEEMVDRFTDMSFAVKGVAQAIGFALFPAVRGIVVQVTEWVAANKELIDARVEEGIKATVRGVTDLYKWTRRVAPQVAAFVKQIGGIKTIAMVLGGIIAVGIIAPLAAVVSMISATSLGITALIAVVGIAAVKIAAHWDSIMESIQPVVDAVSSAADFLPSFTQEQAVAMAGGPQGDQRPMDFSGLSRAASTVSGEIGVRVEANAGSTAELTDGSIPGIDVVDPDRGPLL